MTVRSVRLRRVGFALEGVTLAWNTVGVAILAILAITASSTALAGFGLDSLIEIGASIVVIWELAGTGAVRQRRALLAIGIAFVAVASYLTVQSVVALVAVHHPRGSIGGIVWTAVTAVVMFALAALKTAVGHALGNPVLRTEGRVTFVDGVLAVAVLLGVALDTALGWWWADPVAGLVIAAYAIREAIGILRPRRSVDG